MKPTKETKKDAKHVCQHCNKPIVAIGSSKACAKEWPTIG